jgi:succinyl-CoA synthetase beta subunit
VVSVDRYPVVVKADAMSGHKALSGGVARGVRSLRELRDEARRMLDTFGTVVIEEEAPGGIEMIIAVHDGPFGGIILVGLGGPYAESFGKQTLLTATTDLTLIERAIGGSAVPSVLSAALGRDALAVALRQIAVAASGLVALVKDKQLRSIEINPLIVSRGRSVACDVKAERPVSAVIRAGEASPTAERIEAP